MKKNNNAELMKETKFMKEIKIKEYRTTLNNVSCSSKLSSTEIKAVDTILKTHLTTTIHFQ